MEKISDIKDILKNTSELELYAFIEKYEADSRAGVKTIVKSAKKRLDDYHKELERCEKIKFFENKYSDYDYICGVDEVGRGCLAGPVAAGAVILPKNCDILYINDSKKLSPKKREELSKIIVKKAVATKVSLVSPEVIDDINILQATYRAMNKAISELMVKPDLLLVDAVKIPDNDIKQVAIVKGDSKSISIGAASIVAKVYRDSLMDEYDKLFPEYDFKSNKGYGTQKHIDALKLYGPCPIHRKTFIEGILK